MKARFFRLGEAAVTILLGERITPQVNARVHALSRSLAAATFPGLIEAVPAYCTLTLHYDPLAVTFETVKAFVKSRLKRIRVKARKAGILHCIPVAYGGEFGPDLEAVATETGMTPEQVVALHAGKTYRVYMLGFTPGFPYMGLTSPRLQVKRLATPRTRVPAGAVAIAGRQTGVYPLATPGGWRIIGRTGWRFFDPLRLPPARFEPGDLVRFQPATPAEAGLNGAHAEPRWGKMQPVIPLQGKVVVDVLAGGLLSTIQDNGRFGYQSLGIPVAGAMDRFAYAAANALVGNPAGAAALEITLAGPQLFFSADALIAVTGADLELQVEQPDGRRWPFPGWLAVFVRKGSRLEFTGRRWGCRAYLAQAGGFTVAPLLGSRSTYLAAAIGGIDGRKLKAGDQLPGCEESSDPVFRAGRSWPPSRQSVYHREPMLRIMPGPQWRQFSAGTQRDFLSGKYTVQPDSDRVGVRLQGPGLPRQKIQEVISAGVTAGSIQVPSDGQPIVLGADRQTVGGYAQIAVVIGPDLPLLAQLVPGDQVRFIRVSPAEASAAVQREAAEMLAAQNEISAADPDLTF